MTPRKSGFFYKNGLSLFLFVCFFLFWLGQSLTGWAENNQDLLQHGAPPLAFSHYLGSAHFIEATFENWESEFLQMFLYVLVTVWLRQQGSAESKGLEGPEDVDRPPSPHPDAPWPVRRGGIILTLYKNSLSLTFFLLFALSFFFHARGSYDHYIEEQILESRAVENFTSYLGSARFWFESFQNWQSEFLAIGAIVLLSVWLRQHGSPESKPVDMPHTENP
jgi:hypothetical protein